MWSFVPEKCLNRMISFFFLVISLDSATIVRLDKNLLREFHEAVKGKYGKIKGGQKEAFREAILLWMAFRGCKRAFSVTGKGIREFNEAISALEEFMDNPPKRDECLSLTIRPMFTVFSDEEIKAISKVLSGCRFGKPEKVKIDYTAGGEPCEAEIGVDSILEELKRVEEYWCSKEEDWVIARWLVEDLGEDKKVFEVHLNRDILHAQYILVPKEELKLFKDLEAQHNVQPMMEKPDVEEHR